MQKISPAQQRAALRLLLQDDPFVIAPAVHDVFSLRLVEQAGFASACISGAMLSYALLGIPDLGLLTLTECVEHCRRLVRAASIPVTADADAGYGNAYGVHYAVELFEEAGAAGVNIEDQVVPRRWGSSAGKEVVSLPEMVGKISAACRARQDDNFLIIARTDALATEPLESVIERARAYHEAGADLLLPIGPRSEQEIAALVEASPMPVTISAGTGLGATVSKSGFSLHTLRELGVRRVSLTTLLPGGAAAGMAAALGALAKARGLGQDVLGSAAALSAVAGFDALFDADAQHALESELIRGTPQR